jgi:protein-S-isoprenylcysteine O-methyltransferase Ste14
VPDNLTETAGVQVGNQVILDLGRRKRMVEIERIRHQGDGKPTDGHMADRGGNEERKPPRLFAWLASLVTILLLIATQFLERGDNAYLRGMGVAMLALAGVFIFVPFFLLQKHGQSQDSRTYMQTEAVVDRGLYAITRHPQYLGYMLLVGGFALLSQHWLAVLLAVLGITFFYLQALREERYCLARFGEPYAGYAGQVPRFNIVLGIVRLLHRGRQ